MNHLEGFYRPGDRALAVELVEALGLVAADIRFTAKSQPTLAVHPNGNDRDPTNNVMFLYEMPAVQRKVLDLMEQRIASDPELGAAGAEYRAAASKMPPIMPHFGLRFGSSRALKAVTDRLETGVSPELAKRISIWEVPPYESIDGLPDIRQVFVRTNVFSMGAVGLEQAINRSGQARDAEKPRRHGRGQRGLGRKKSGAPNVGAA